MKRKVYIILPAAIIIGGLGYILIKWLLWKTQPKEVAPGELPVPFSLPFATGSAGIMYNVIKNYGSIIKREATAQGVSPHLIAAMISQESAGRPDATSRAGARGLMQLMDSTAKEMGIDNPRVDSYNPEKNIRAGVKYIKQQIDRFKDVNTALAAYNAGPGKVCVRTNWEMCSKETREYVKRVNMFYNVYPGNLASISDIWTYGVASQVSAIPLKVTNIIFI